MEPPHEPSAWVRRLTTLSVALRNAEWNFHSAIRDTDQAEAGEAASDAIEVLKVFLRELESAEQTCEDANALVDKVVSEELARWEEWSDRRGWPNRDEIELFFAFYSSEAPWLQAVIAADAGCRLTALPQTTADPRICLRPGRYFEHEPRRLPIACGCRDDPLWRQRQRAALLADCCPAY